MEDVAVDLYAFLGGDSHFQRYEWLGLHVVDPCSQTARYLTPPHCQDVFVPFGDDEAGLCTLALQYRIRASRCAMVDVFELAIPAVLFLQNTADLFYAFLHTNGLVARIRRDFGAYCFAVGSDYADISEGATCVSVCVQRDDF